MKTTIKNLILSAVLVVGGASCVDLDTAPYDRETDLTYWEEDPEAAVKVRGEKRCVSKFGRSENI